MGGVSGNMKCGKREKVKLRRLALTVSVILTLGSVGLFFTPAGANGDSVVINELAHSPNDGPDWLELHNPTALAIDVSNWSVDGVNADIPTGTSIAPGDYLVLTRDVAEFQTEYPSFQGTILPMDGGLSGGGELLELIDAGGSVVDAVEYGSVAPWPSEPSSGDVTLSLFDPLNDNALAASWGISAAAGGTPGAANDTVPGTVEEPPLVIINEIHYNPADDDGDTEFVELFNADTTTVDISGFDLDGMITFPAGTEIQPGDFLVITQNLADFSARYPGVAALEWATDEDLSNGGENVRLETDAGIRIDEVEYDDRDDWPTEPDGEGPSLELIDPTFDNSLFASWEVSLPGGSPGVANDVAPAAMCNGLVVTVDLAAGDTATAGNDVILGTSNADIISGLGGDDTICGEGGDDIISGQAGNDTILGGDGADVVNGGAGDDIVDGDDGDDDLRGQGGDDILNGGDGVDQFFGGSGADTITTGDGGNAGTAQVVQGQGGPDTIFGSPQDDVLNGAAGQDEIHGGAGNDFLNGGRSGDTLFGDAGDDQLAGGPGRDTLDGGADTDDCNGGGNTNDSATATCETLALVP